MAGSETRSSGALPDLKTMEADISGFLQEMADQGWVVVQHEDEEP